MPGWSRRSLVALVGLRVLLLNQRFDLGPVIEQSTLCQRFRALLPARKTYSELDRQGIFQLPVADKAEAHGVSPICDDCPLQTALRSSNATLST